MIEDSIAKQRVAQFHRRHGGVCYSDDRHWYYSNGAFRDIEPLGLLADPMDPSTREGEYRNAENIVTFYRLKRGEAAAKFDALNNQLKFHVPARPKEALAELKRLAAEVQKCSRELGKAIAKKDSTEIGRYRKAVKKSEEEQKQRSEEFQQLRKAIRI
jgi:hypothetical protein